MKSFLLSLLLMLCCSCEALRDIPADGGLRQQLVEMAGSITDVAFRLKGTELLREHAPGLIALMDKPTLVEGGDPLPPDGVVSIEEFVDFVRSADATTIALLGAIYFQ